MLGLSRSVKAFQCAAVCCSVLQCVAVCCSGGYIRQQVNVLDLMLSRLIIISYFCVIAMCLVKFSGCVSLWGGGRGRSVCQGCR